MKQVVKCLGCNKVVGLYKSYKAHIKDRVTGMLTGEVKEVEYVGRICKECSAAAGYKVRVKKVVTK